MDDDKSKKIDEFLKNRPSHQDKLVQKFTTKSEGKNKSYS